MDPRSMRRQQLESASARLATANQSLRLAHKLTARYPEGDPAAMATLQTAQALVVTLEQEVAMLENAIARDDPETEEDADSAGGELG